MPSGTKLGWPATAALHHSAMSPWRQAVVGAGASIDGADATITASPAFVARAANDLRPTAASPTIDAGTADVDSDGDVDATDASLAGRLDFGGHPRVQGIPDVGADEASPASGAAPTPTPTGSASASVDAATAATTSSAAPAATSAAASPPCDCSRRREPPGSSLHDCTAGLTDSAPSGLAFLPATE